MIEFPSFEILPEDLSEGISHAYAQDAWHLSYDEISESLSHPIHVCYQYMDMGDTGYGFNQEFCVQDALMYFRIMRCFANNTIQQLIQAGGRGVKVDNEGHQVCLRRNNALHRTLREPLSKIDEDLVKGDPMIFHYGLYTDPNGKASRETGVRSPRIYFMLGVYGLIYPLLFDPYHELTVDKEEVKKNKQRP